MDWSSIIVGVLAFIGTLVGAYFSNNKTVELISYRITTLEKKVEKHNHVVERVTVAENDIKNMKVEIKEVKSEVHELKNDTGGHHNE